MSLPSETAYELRAVGEIENTAEVDTKGESSHHENPAQADRAVYLESAFSLCTKWELAKLFWRIILLSGCVLTGALFEGYAVVLPGSIAANKSFIRAFGTVKTATGVALNAQYVSAWSGMSAGSQLISLVLGGFISDRYGRKILLHGVYIFIAIAFTLEITAKNWLYFLFARGTCGFAVGLAKACLPCYVAEIVPAGLRSSVLSLFFLWTIIGQFASAVALQIVQANDLPWQHAIYSQLVFLGLFVPVAIAIPESPWYYANKLNHDQAKAILRKLNGKVPGYDIEREYAVMASDVARQQALRRDQASVGWTELYKGVNLRRTWVSFLPIASQQLAGSQLVSAYVSYFFSVSGSSISPFIPTVISNTINVVFTIIATFTVLKLGRRPLIITCLGLMTIADLLLGIMGVLQDRNGGVLSNGQAAGVTAASCIWLASQAMGPGPLAFVMVADTSTPLLRAKTSGFALAMAGAFGLIFSYVTPLMISAQSAGWGIKTGFFFAPLAALCTILAFFTLPETSGRSYTELDELFEARVPARKFSRTTTQAQMQAREALKGV